MRNQTIFLYTVKVLEISQINVQDKTDKTEAYSIPALFCLYRKRLRERAVLSYTVANHG